MGKSKKGKNMTLHELLNLLKGFEFKIPEGVSVGKDSKDKKEAIVHLHIYPGVDKDTVLQNFNQALTTVVKDEFPEYLKAEHPNQPATLCGTLLEFEKDIVGGSVECCFTIYYTVEEP